MPRQLALLIGLTAAVGLAGCSRPAPAPPVPTGTQTTTTSGEETAAVAAETVDENPAPATVATEDENPAPVESAAGVPAGFETPEAAFAAMKEAIGNEDFAGAARCMTEESQQLMATGLMLVAGLMAAFGGDEAAPLTAVFEKHDFNMEGPAEGDGERKLPEDLPAFLGDLVAALETMGESPGEGPTAWANAELVDLTIDGDTASGTVVIQSDDGEKSEPAEFRNTASGWLVHLGGMEDLLSGGLGGPMIGRGDEGPSAPLAESELEEGLSSNVSLSFEMPFEQPFFGKEFPAGTLFVTLNLVGNVILDTYEYGELQLVAAEDSSGTALEFAAPPTDGFDMELGESFVELNDFFLDKKNTLPILFALTAPAAGAEQLATLELSVKLKVRESVVVKDVLASLGETITVEDVGDFTINKQDADNGNPDHGLQIEYKGKEDGVQNITLLDGEGMPLDTSGTFSFGFGNSRTFGIGTDGPLPDGLQMRVSLGGSESIKVVPLTFEDLALER